ncbi:M24 family metallopeptidase [Dactylosporangium sp. CA-233914]|uniref:M24 family metallopeptidase n=1 Tax=Dactylosporangium sp. CA-233914 TaxID=3239934 RepID=UPI003D93632B
MTRDVAAFRPIIDDLRVDGLLLMSPQSFIWSTGLRIPSHSLMRWRYACAFVNAAGVDAVLSVDMEASTVAEALHGPALYVWREFDDDAMAVLAGMIRERAGTGPLRLGVETDYLPARAMDALRDLLPAVTWVPCEEEVARGRMSKTADETEVIRKLVTASDSALADALAAVRVGDTEFEIAERIVSSLYTSGVDEHRALIVASGPRSQYPNVPPSDRKIEHGDLIRVEVFGGAGGYHGGVARTAVVGEPAPEVAQLWSALSGARSAGLAALRPGADPRAVYAAYVEALGPLREYAIAFWGHGMGLDLHEPPYISAGSTDELIEGAIVGVEPFAMVPGRFGLQVKDVVRLTSGGVELLSQRLDGGVLHVVGD